MRFIGTVGFFKLYLSIKTAKSGIYFPAYDYPAIQNPFLVYYGYFLKKSNNAFKLSLAVIESLYAKLVFKLYEYPTPAGDYKNNKFDTLYHEY